VGQSMSFMCWWLETAHQDNASMFSLQGGKIFHFDLGYANGQNLDAEIAWNFKYSSSKPYRQIGTADIQLGPSPFPSYLNGGVFGPALSLNTPHCGLLTWDAAAQMLTYYQDGAVIAAVYVPSTQLSGGLKGLLVMIGNFYDHDASNSVIGLVGPCAL